MKRLLKWFGLIFGVLLAAIIVAVVGIYVVSNNRINQEYEITVEQIPILNDAEAIAQGEHGI